MSKTYIGTYAISLWQPWAALWALGGDLGKQYETRHWELKPYILPRPLVIHAAQKWDSAQREFCQTQEVKQALWHWRTFLAEQHNRAERLAKYYEEIGRKPARAIKWGYVPFDKTWGIYLPLGAYIGAGTLVRCRRADSVSTTTRERAFGDFWPGRWAWLLEDRVRLHYRAARGYPKWWKVAEELQEVG